jgi:tripartite-type tricarboxylate transporter receptor subunit TctC
MINRRTATASLVLAPFATPAFAQAFPSRPIQMLVGFAPGGGADVVARVLGPHLAQELGQPVVVENRPGVGGNVATRYLATEAKADGHTILMGTIAALAINPNIYKEKLGFDPDRDLAPITNAVDSCNVLVVPVSSPLQDVNQLVAAAKTEKSLTYGSSGVGTAGHLAGVLLSSLTGTKPIHVPYKSGGGLMTAMLSGEVDFSFASGVTAVAQVRGGKLRALAVTTAKRASELPAVPTMLEAGVTGFVSNNWYGIVAPAATPRPVIDRLNAACVKVLAKPEVVAALRAQVLEASPMSPDEFGAFMRAERAKWGKLIRESGVKMET